MAVTVPNLFPATSYNTQAGADLNKVFGNGAEFTEVGLTATASGTQATSYLLSGGFAQVSTVASGNDGLLLPPGVPGMHQTIRNDGANTLKVFGSGTDKINTTAAATGVTVATNKTARFTFTLSGWFGEVALA